MPQKNLLTKYYLTYLDHVEKEYVNLLTYEAMIDKEIFKLYEIEGEDLEQILREQGTPAGFFPVVEGFEVVPEDMLEQGKDYIRNLERIELPPEELDEVGNKLKELYEKGKSIEEISIALKINPVSVAAMRKELELVNQKGLKHEVENLLTYLIIEELKKDKDGIIPLIKDSPEPTMAERIILRLEEIFGEDNVAEVLEEMKVILGVELEKWLSKDFFKKHISQYKKRPIVWHFKSKGKSFEAYVYYHKLNDQTLKILRNKYLAKTLDINKERLWSLEKELKEADNKAKSKINREIEKLELIIEDLERYRDALDEVIKTGYSPVIDDGVLANISPIQKAGLLSQNVLNKNQLEKGLKLLKEYIEERKQNGKD